MLSVNFLYRTTAAVLCSQLYSCTTRLMTGGYDPSRGAGAGGGGGGSIRNAGGSFAKLQAVREEEFFLNQQNELIRRLKGKKITLDEYHTTRSKALEGYIKLSRK